eukprot:CAMPEP_0116013394 /NCGR_PEP_ID=MMETSP0321-20121206/5703_1 /TAXON_ID=163516 /ORGANISM="Leptocylindrus danicus var. danicus, Strain B650" /LENGTH=645 /DNA_ID=CAMNT_0003482941 /DNA_START=33 /DNA_END=1970 /DNA_ORIENTATION=+
MSMGVEGASKKNNRTKNSRKSMIPKIANQQTTITFDSNDRSLSPAHSSRNAHYRRKSIAVEHTRNSTSIGAGRQSVAVSRMDDPRPVSDKAYIKKSINSLYKYLMNSGYDHPITIKSLHLPSAKDFNHIVTFLLRRVDPTFNDGSSSIKFEDEVTLAFKLLNYPFTISKTGLVAAGSPHTWPALLAALSWLVELLQYDEVLEGSTNEDKNDDFENEENMKDVVNDPEKMVKRKEKAFFTYLLDAYESFLCGDDDRYDQLEEQLISVFEQDNVLIEREKEQFMEVTLNILEMMEELDQKGSQLPELENRRENYCDDLEKFRELERQLNEHKEALESKVLERKNDLQRIGNDLETTTQQVSRLKEIVGSQALSIEDEENMEKERKVVEETIDRIMAEKTVHNNNTWENEMKLSRELENISSTLQAYNSKAKQLRIESDTPKTSNENQLLLQLDRDRVSKGEKSIFVYGLDINEIREALGKLKEILSGNSTEAKSKLLEVLDEEDTSEEILSEKDDEVKALDSRLKKSDELYNRETEELRGAIAVLQNETKTIETKISSIRDPVALEAALARHECEHTELEALRQEKMDEYALRKSAVTAEIVRAVEIMTNHKEYVQKRLYMHNEYIQVSLESTEQLDTGIIEELDSM